MSFGGDVSRFARKAERRIETAVRKIALEAFTRVIMRSPVDTGRFRGNWQVAIGNVPNGTVELEDATGTATVSAVQAKTMELQVGEAIYLVNNLPYARRLEYGYSSQAPNGMVRLTVLEFRPIVEQVAEQLSRET